MARLEHRKLTDAVVEKLPIRDHRYELRDTRDRLWLRVSPNRIKSWLVYYKVSTRQGGDGKQRRKVIGRYPKMKTAEARDTAREYIDLAHSGIDPAAPKDVHTFGELGRDWLTHNTASAGTKVHYESSLRLHLLPVLKDRELHTLTRAWLTDKIFRPLAKTKVGAARKARNVGRMVWGHAAGYGYVKEADNPFVGLMPSQLAETKNKGKVLTPEDVAAVWAATGDMDYPYGPLLRLLLLTGQRRGDVAGMRWGEIKDDWWVIPAARYKTDREHRVFLAEPAREILGNLPRWSSSLTFVVRSKKKRGLVEASGATRTFNEVVKPKLSDQFRLHDLRHTFSTVAEETLKVPARVVRACMGHAESGIGSIYTHADYAEEREDTLRRYADWVMSCL